MAFFQPPSFQPYTPYRRIQGWYYPLKSTLGLLGRYVNKPGKETGASAFTFNFQEYTMVVAV
jgi:hypothetical protein